MHQLRVDRYLVGAAGVLELARVETGAAAEEVVNLTRLHVVREPRYEERIDVAPIILLVQVVRIEGRLSHTRRRIRRQWWTPGNVGEDVDGGNRRWYHLFCTDETKRKG